MLTSSCMGAEDAKSSYHAMLVIAGPLRRVHHIGAGAAAAAAGIRAPCRRSWPRCHHLLPLVGLHCCVERPGVRERIRSGNAPPCNNVPASNQRKSVRLPCARTAWILHPAPVNALPSQQGNLPCVAISPVRTAKLFMCDGADGQYITR
jgi:hypothetical protein